MTFSTAALKRHAAEHEAMKQRGITPTKGKAMPAKKKRFSKKQDRMASHVAKSMRKRSKSTKDAKSIGYAVAQKNKKKSSKDSQGRNVTTKTKPKRKASKRRSRNIGRS